MTDKILSNGYRLITISTQCFAQLPPGFCGETIPDEYIFQPAWNRAQINHYWKVLTQDQEPTP